MTLVVEDGTGLATANSFGSVAEADAYFADRPTQDAVWTLGSTAQKEEVLVLGTMYLCAVFGSEWIGRRGSNTQALDWPRTSAETEDGYTYDSDEVPTPVKHALFELAVRAAPIGSDTLLEDITNPGTIERTRDKVGDLETEVKYGGAGASQHKDYPIIRGILRRLLWSTNRIARG